MKRISLGGGAIERILPKAYPESCGDLIKKRLEKFGQIQEEIENLQSQLKDPETDAAKLPELRQSYHAKQNLFIEEALQYSAELRENFAKEHKAFFLELEKNESQLVLDIEYQQEELISLQKEMDTLRSALINTNESKAKKNINCDIEIKQEKMNASQLLIKSLEAKRRALQLEKYKNYQPIHNMEETAAQLSRCANAYLDPSLKLINEHKEIIFHKNSLCDEKYQKMEKIYQELSNDRTFYFPVRMSQAIHEAFQELLDNTRQAIEQVKGYRIPEPNENQTFSEEAKESYKQRLQDLAFIGQKYRACVNELFDHLNKVRETKEQTENYLKKVSTLSNFLGNGDFYQAVNSYEGLSPADHKKSIKKQNKEIMALQEEINGVLSNVQDQGEGLKAWCSDMTISQSPETKAKTRAEWEELKMTNQNFALFLSSYWEYIKLLSNKEFLSGCKKTVEQHGNYHFLEETKRIKPSEFDLEKSNAHKEIYDRIIEDLNKILEDRASKKNQENLMAEDYSDLMLDNLEGFVIEDYNSDSNKDDSAKKSDASSSDLEHHPLAMNRSSEATKFSFEIAGDSYMNMAQANWSDALKGERLKKIFPDPWAKVMENPDLQKTGENLRQLYQQMMDRSSAGHEFDEALKKARKNKDFEHIFQKFQKSQEKLGVEDFESIKNNDLKNMAQELWSQLRKVTESNKATKDFENAWNEAMGNEAMDNNNKFKEIFIESWDNLLAKKDVKRIFEKHWKEIEKVGFSELPSLLSNMQDVRNLIHPYEVVDSWNHLFQIHEQAMVMVAEHKKKFPDFYDQPVDAKFPFHDYQGVGFKFIKDHQKDMPSFLEDMKGIAAIFADTNL